MYKHSRVNPVERITVVHNHLKEVKEFNKGKQSSVDVSKGTDFEIILLEELKKGE